MPMALILRSAKRISKDEGHFISMNDRNPILRVTIMRIALQDEVSVRWR